MSDSFVAPSINVDSFVCPHCGIHSQHTTVPVIESIHPDQTRSELYHSHKCTEFVGADTFVERYDYSKLMIKKCMCCNGFTFFVNKKLVWPDPATVKPSEYMPMTMLEPYNEAQSIASRSPSAAAGLLRLALERFCEYRNIKGGNLASRIDALGLPKQLAEAAHACRHLGNDGVHEGFIYYDKEATFEIVNQMSRLLNLIVDQTIGLEEQTKSLIEMHNNRK